MTDNIIQVTDSGYEIDFENMTMDRKYYFTFDGSKYATWKINSYEIALQEITLIA